MTGVRDTDVTTSLVVKLGLGFNLKTNNPPSALLNFTSLE